MNRRAKSKCFVVFLRIELIQKFMVENEWGGVFGVGFLKWVLEIWNQSSNNKQMGICIRHTRSLGQGCRVHRECRAGAPVTVTGPGPPFLTGSTHGTGADVQPPTAPGTGNGTRLSPTYLNFLLPLLQANVNTYRSDRGQISKATSLPLKNDLRCGRDRPQQRNTVKNSNVNERTGGWLAVNMHFYISRREFYFSIQSQSICSVRYDFRSLRSLIECRGLALSRIFCAANSFLPVCPVSIPP